MQFPIPSVLELMKFQSKFKINKESNCWEWTGSVDCKGYGQHYISGTFKKKISKKAHRISKEWLGGELVLKGLCVCHTCDNPCCVNPDHLFLGTHQDNMQDKIAKGRQASGVNCGSHKKALTGDHWNKGENNASFKSTLFSTHWNKGENNASFKTSFSQSGVGSHWNAGERNNSAKLKKKDIPIIRKQYSNGCSAKDLAKEYGVSSATILDACYYRTWKHA